MTKNEAEGSSAFVVISRKSLIIGMLGASLLSFAAGYLWGYEGSSSGKLVTTVDADSKKIVSDEKTVLDSSGKAAIPNPVDTPGVIPKELIPRPSGQTRSTPNKAETRGIPEAQAKQTENKGKPEAQPKQIEVRKDLKKEQSKPDRKVELAMGQKPQVAPEKKPEQKPAPENRAEVKQGPAKNEQPADKKKPAATKKQKTTGKKKAAVKDGKKGQKKIARQKQANRMYSVQVGSFLDPQKAARLKEDLQGKGFTAHIVTGRQSQGKTFSKVRIGAYRAKADAEEIMPKLREMGLDCIIVPAQK